MSPPLSPSEIEEADLAKMHHHQEHSQIMKIRRAPSILAHQQISSQEGNDVADESRSAWCGSREAVAFEGGIPGRDTRGAYGHDFEYTGKATAYYGYHGGWADWQQGQQVSVACPLRP